MQNSFYIGVTTLMIILYSAGALSDEKVPNEKSHKLKLPPCRACKIFVDSFKKGLKRTAQFKFEGGDTAWEEKNLGSYANSEVRFVEIHEKLCSEVVEGKDQCYQLLEDYDELNGFLPKHFLPIAKIEHVIVERKPIGSFCITYLNMIEHFPALETWWFKKQKDEPDLVKHLCIDTFKVCCPEFHFGRNCTPCEGFPDNICHNNGKCKGSGTRKGNGKCLCDAGYTGDYCDSCADGFHESYRHESKILCSQCHPSCENRCSKAGPAGCEKCKEGYLENKDRGCTDVNECLMGKSPCTQTQFCINSEGSYRCLDCHQSCLGCTGDGPDECISCASGYKKKYNICVNISEEGRKNYISMTRYFTYFGLCVCTCIILHKNVSIAAFVGLCVGIYITLSEYMANAPDLPKDDLKDQLADQLKKAFNSP